MQHESLAGGPGGRGKAGRAPGRALAPGCRKQLEEDAALRQQRAAAARAGNQGRLPSGLGSRPRETETRPRGLNTQLTQNAPNALPCREANRTRRHGVTWFQRREVPARSSTRKAWKTCLGEGGQTYAACSPAAGGGSPEAGRAGRSPQPSSRHRACETRLLPRRISSTRPPCGISKPHPKIQNFTHPGSLEVLVATCSNVSYNIEFNSLSTLTSLIFLHLFDAFRREFKLGGNSHHVPIDSTGKERSTLRGCCAVKSAKRSPRAFTERRESSCGRQARARRGSSCGRQAQALGSACTGGARARERAGPTDSQATASRLPPREQIPQGRLALKAAEQAHHRR